VNLDVVTTISFPGVEDAVAPTSKSATEIKVTAPDGATSGNLVLNTASGKTASVAIVTLKPEIQSYNPASVAAGTDVTIKGKNLDLVASVTFGGDKAVEVTPASSTELKVTVPVDAETGEVTLTMKNGETTKGASLTVTKPETCYIPVLPDPDAEIKSGTILVVEVENADKLTGVQVNGNTVQYILKGSTLNILVPSNANGNTEFKLISSNGEIVYTIYITSSGRVETVVYEGPIELSKWSNNFSIPKVAFENVATGSIMKIYYTVVDASPQVKFNDDNWAVIEIADDPNFELQWGVLNLPADATSYEIILTDYILTRILTYVANWNNPAGTIIAGQQVIISKISVITGG
jgi:hypothetical protein